MLFNSFEYLLFFLFVLSLSWLFIGFKSLRIFFLLIASYYFYVSNNHWLIVLILTSTQIDYFCGLMIDRCRNDSEKKKYLVFSLIANLGILAYFKYANFFTETIIDSVNLLGRNIDYLNMDIALPVGISFYTFQSMSYTLDVYSGKMKVEKSWLKFSFFVAFFPQLVAGPIVRAKHFIPQITKRPSLSSAEMEAALFQIMKGLFKKIVLADFLALYANAAFSSPESSGVVATWVGIYAFSFQIYFDFSGYSDIAIGCAKLMGFNLPVNFRQPYMADSITDFWRRWHISLSTWLRDYLYVPLGGNRMKSLYGIYRNIMLTMLLGGLWHGASMHFIIWGGLHGLILILERVTGFYKQNYVSGLSFHAISRKLLVFQLVTFIWMFFRCQDMNSLLAMISSLFTFSEGIVATKGELAAMLIVALSFLMQGVSEYSKMQQKFVRLPIPIKATVYSFVAIIILIVNSDKPTAFIYFQF